MPDNMTHFFNQFDYASLLQNAIRIVIILVVAFAIWFVIRYFISRFALQLAKRAETKGEGIHGARERADTISNLLKKIVAAFYWIAVALTLLSQIGIDIGALVAGAGIFGLAFAFGAQELVKNYVSGFFIVLENQISVGDIAVVNGTWGTVEAINFRTTVLRNMDGTVHVFSNGDITQLTNATKGWGGYVFKIGVAYKENVDHVIDVIRRVGDEMKKDDEYGPDMLDDMEIHGVNSLEESGYIIRGRFTTTPMNQWATGRAFLGRVKTAFDKEGIEMPFPHRTLYFGKEGAPFLSGEGESQSATGKESY